MKKSKKYWISFEVGINSYSLFEKSYADLHQPSACQILSRLEFALPISHKIDDEKYKRDLALHCRDNIYFDDRLQAQFFRPLGTFCWYLSPKEKFYRAWLNHRYKKMGVTLKQAVHSLSIVRRVEDIRRKKLKI